jgi:hypothetical protein
MRKRMIFAIFAVIAILTVAVSPVGAVTNAEMDGNRHPNVGLMVAQGANGIPLWRCSGSLLSSTLFLTAGHCTEARAAHVEIWTNADAVRVLTESTAIVPAPVASTMWTGWII